MKKIYLLLTSVAISGQLFSQISINASDLPQAGDTVLVGISTQFNSVDYTTTGANQTWDFSYLTANSERIDTFFNVSSSSALYQLSFNNFLSPDYKADYYNRFLNNNIPSIPGGQVSIDNPVFFTKNSASKSEIVGIGVEVNGVEVPVRADTIDMIYQFPMTFNNSWTSRSYLYMDMNPAFDAVFVRHQLRQSTVDGWGTITTPFGTYDAIRVKSTITYTDSIKIDILGTGNPTWLPVPTPQDIEYTWWSNNNKIPLLKIIERNGFATVIEFRGVTDYASISEKINETYNVKIYPNPTTNLINIELTDYENANIQIIDITGQIVQSIASAKQINTIDISTLNRGVYFVKIITQQQNVTKQFVKQ
ncbi:MAG TPA: T9SS type A sorting domain-containing protein [Crocinitomix sp.]|nr:T9SS type A sorting domain-containing protein [Crocinitomix sp.]